MKQSNLMFGKAMEEEISVIEKNKTWELVERSINKDVVGVKWIYKSTFNEDVSFQKTKQYL